MAHGVGAARRSRARARRDSRCRDGSGGSTGSSERALGATNVANSTLAIFCLLARRACCGCAGQRCTCREIATSAVFERWPRLSRVHLDRAGRPPTKIRGLTCLFEHITLGKVRSAQPQCACVWAGAVCGLAPCWAPGRGRGGALTAWATSSSPARSAGRLRLKSGVKKISAQVGPCTARARHGRPSMVPGVLSVGQSPIRVRR